MRNVSFPCGHCSEWEAQVEVEDLVDRVMADLGTKSLDMSLLIMDLLTMRNRCICPHFQIGLIGLDVDLVGGSLMNRISGSQDASKRTTVEKLRVLINFNH
jgi:hypothetical protein